MTKTTASSSQNRLFDIVRKVWVADRPEERIRCGLLRQMVEELGYPPHLIAVELPLSKFSTFKKVPNRRIDIVVFTKELVPLLMVECKAKGENSAAWEQVVGYNYYLGAPFLAIASAEGVWTAPSVLDWRESAMNRLPSYLELQ